MKIAHRLKTATMATLAVLISMPSARAIKAWAPCTIASQELGSTKEGWYASLLPFGRTVVAGPRYHFWSLIKIQAGVYTYWVQEDRKNHFTVFTVNEAYWFYRDQKWFWLADDSGKRHKFLLVAAIKQPQ